MAMELRWLQCTVVLSTFPLGVTIREAMNKKYFRGHKWYYACSLLNIFQMVTLFGEQKFFEIRLENSGDYFL